jgi:RNase H-like domain found in reverse transcriptase
MPDPAKPFVIESDASKFATGAVLRQKDENGDWHPCRFISHSFDATQQNYEIYDRELLGIIRTLETWRHYIQGSPHPITIFSNHKNLTFFQQAQKLNRCQAHWSLFLSQFDMKLVHVPGKICLIHTRQAPRDFCVTCVTSTLKPFQHFMEDEI